MVAGRATVGKRLVFVSMEQNIQNAVASVFEVVKITDSAKFNVRRGVGSSEGSVIVGALSYSLAPSGKISGRSAPPRFNEARSSPTLRSVQFIHQLCHFSDFIPAHITSHGASPCRFQPECRLDGLSSPMTLDIVSMAPATYKSCALMICLFPAPSRKIAMQLLVTILPFLLGTVLGEDGSQGWLRYAPAAKDCESQKVPSAIVALNATKISPVYTAGQELHKGLKSILGKAIDVTSLSASNSSAIIVGSVDAYTKAYGDISGVEELEDDGFLLSTEANNVLILGRNERGALYGAFEYLSQVARNNLTTGHHISNPQAPIRWTNEWDNMDGSVERGYGGASNFFRAGYVVDNTTRAAEYARLLASVGINGVIVNNVNANATLLSDRNIEGLGRLADAMRPYGVQLGISLNFASPNATLGTFDPLDPKVDAWWANITDQIYKKVSVDSEMSERGY